MPEPNAMVVATADASGAPEARVMLLKGFDARGFTFFTNYDSRKGRTLAANPRAALCFFWHALERTAKELNVPVNALVARIDALRIEAERPPNLTSALRLWLFDRAANG